MLLCCFRLFALLCKQIEQHIAPGTFRVYTCHGAQKGDKDNKLADMDIVITSYGTLAKEMDYFKDEKVSDLVLNMHMHTTASTARDVTGDVEPEATIGKNAD